MTKKVALIVVSVFAGVGCGDDANKHADGGSNDGMATLDVKIDAGADRTGGMANDAGPDVAVDTTAEKASDGASDALPDASADVPPDASANDATTDLAPDQADATSVAEAGGDVNEASVDRGDYDSHEAGPNAIDSGAGDGLVAGGDGAGDATTISTACGKTTLDLAGVCLAYCDDLFVDDVCVGSDAQFDSMAACMAACMAPTWSCGSFGDQTGNSVLCRLTYGDMAADADAGSPARSAACANAGPRSTTCR